MLSFNNAQAEIYKCESEGKTTFSQTPCEIDNPVIIEVNEGYSPDKSSSGRILTLILQNKITMGMTNNDVVKSWGRPDDINSSTGSYGTHEQWVYRRGNSNNQYVYFENNSVTSWSNN